MRTKLNIEGLNCSHCVNAVTEILKEIDGVNDVNVQLPDAAEFDYDENLVSIDVVKQAINSSEIYKVI